MSAPKRIPPSVWAERLKEMCDYFEHRDGGETQQQRNEAARKALEVMDAFEPDPDAPMPEKTGDPPRSWTVYEETHPKAADRIRRLTEKVAASCPPPMKRRSA